MRAIDKKLLKDLYRLWPQLFAVALVMACGVATIILAVGNYRSLEETRSAFYERYRFAHIFAAAVRAPLRLKSQIAVIPGVSAFELRVAHTVLLDVPGMLEPATGLAVSIPDSGEPKVNKLYLKAGRFPEPGRVNEIAVAEGFAKAHGFEPGDRFHAIMNGHKHQLTIVGLVLSPEHIYALGPGDMIPDQRRFAVFFMPAKILRGLYDMEDAFNDLAVTTLRGANADFIIERLDDLLADYGGSGAFTREDQISHAFLDSELTQLRAMASIIPPIFLFVSAFLVNMVLSRLIALEREQIGLLKALGYSSRLIGAQYAKLVLITGTVGLIIGSIAGLWLGRELTRLFGEFYSFPFLIFRQSFDLYVIAGGISMAAALAGAAHAIWNVISLPPAVAMRPPAPANYHSFFGQAWQRFQLFSQLTMMALRHLLRWPLRSLLTTLGTALSVALLVVAFCFNDSLGFMIDTIFFRAERQHATITFTDDQNYASLASVTNLPGVLRAEPFRATPVIIRNGHKEKRLMLQGTLPDPDLARILDLDLEQINPTPGGTILSERLATFLDLRPGASVEIEIMEKDRRIEPVTVTAVSQSYVGIAAHMHLDQLNRLMHDGRLVSGAKVLVDEARLKPLYDEIKETPEITSISLQKISQKRFRETIEQNILISATVYTVLAVIMTFGVIYNSARIQLSERAAELASLRVFGFTKGEVSSVLFTELAIIVMLAQPLGWAFGYGFAWSVIKGFESDLFRVPLIVSVPSYALATLIVFLAALSSALVVRRRINNLDLIRVLKTKE